MESKDKPRAMASGIQSAGEPRCFFANTVQDLSVLSAGLCILSRLLWQVVPAIRGIRQKHIDYRYELSGTYVHTLHAHIYTLTHTQRFLFPQLCWAIFPPTVWRDNTVICKPFRNRTRFLPNWIISFYTLCQFLEINNRPFHIGLWSHQLSHGIFPDVSSLGCYYKKHRPSWPVAGLRYLLFCKMTWSCATQGLAEGDTQTLTSGQSLEL